MKRWAEHYQQLYYTENIITDTAAESTSLLPVMNELYVPPSVGEPRGAINSLAFCKAPVNDGIPSEAIKAGMNTALLHHLHEPLLQCWEEGTVPRTCATPTSSRSTRTRETAATNNYPEMSLLSINGKAFIITRLVLNKLQTLAERLYPEALCGFRARRWTIDMIFSLRQLQEKCGEQRKHLHIALIDLTKAFDLVSRVCSLSCREWDATQAPKDDHVFPWRHARNRPVRRLGYVLAPTLFGIFFSLLLSYALSQSEDGVYLHTRSDGNLFNLARLRAKTTVRKVLLRDTLRVPYRDSSAPSHTIVACLVSP